MRPPVREMAIDTVERIWRDDDFMEARPQARKVLAKWRPGVLEVMKKDVDIKETKGGIAISLQAVVNGGVNGNGTAPHPPNPVDVAPKEEHPASVSIAASESAPPAVEDLQRIKTSSPQQSSHSVDAVGGDAG